MTITLYDRVKETCSAPGMGTVTLLGAVQGFQSFSIVGNGNPVYYCIADQNGTKWEVAKGTWNTGGTLTRIAGNVLAGSSGAGTLVNFSSGTQNVFATYPASEAVYQDNSNSTVNVGTNRVTNVVDPTGAQDAATKNYVDLAVAAIQAKNDCQTATTVALAANTYNNGTSGVGATITLTVAAVLVLDGYTPVLNDRILVKNEGTASHNGIYYLSTVGTALVQAVLTRSLDFDQPGDGINGALVYVLNGTVNGNTLWSCTTNATIVFGTTNINWSKFLGSTYTADETTLHLSGTIFSLLATIAQAETISVSDAGTINTPTVFTLDHSTSGTPAAGFGLVFQFTLQDSTTAGQDAGFIAVTWASATHASRKSKWLFKVADATSDREFLRAESSGTAAQIGFFGTTSAGQQTGDAGTALVTFGLMSGTPTFASANITGNNVTNVATAGLATGGPITSTGTITVTAAVKSDQTTGTSTTVAVVPNVQQNHASACKAWAEFSVSGGVVTVNANYGVSSISRSGTGQYSANWSTSFTTSTYAAVGSVDNNGPAVVIMFSSLATGSCAINTYTGAFTSAVEAHTAYFAAFGTQ